MINFLKKFNNKNYILNKENLKKIYYNDLLKNIYKQINFFKAYNIKSGDTVASFIPNSIENIVLFVACGLYGIKFLPIDCNTPEKKLNELIKKLGVKKLFIDKNNKLLNEKFNIPIECNTEFAWLNSYRSNKIKLKNNGKLILFTSGTTGNNKLIQIDFRKLVESSSDFVKFYKLKNQTFLNIFQTSYLGGIFNSFLIPVMASSNIIFFSFFSSVDIFNFWKHIKNYNISTVWFTPPLIKSLIELTDNKSIKKFRCKLNFAFCGTAYLDKKIKKKFNNYFGTNILENYGLSETTFVSLEEKRSKNTYKKGFVGTILKKVNIKLIDVDKKNNKEIILKSKYIFDGYLNLNGNLSIQNNTYFKTGDVGKTIKINKKNFLFIFGRKNEIIKKKGNLINLNLIEELFQTNKLVDDAKAVSILDKSNFEDYNIFIKLKKKQNKIRSLNQINNWAILNLNRNLFPKEIIIKSRFPKTRSGKVKIFKL